MRIALACRRFVTHGTGGMEHVCGDRARELARQGHDVHILTSGKPSEAEWEGCTVHQVGGLAGKYSQELADGSAEACKRLAPEIIHMDSFEQGRPWWADKPGGARRTAITIHGTGFGWSLTRWNHYRLGLCGEPPGIAWTGAKAHRDAIALADCALAISQYEQWVLTDFYGLRGVALVHNPIAPEFFATEPVEAPAKGPWLVMGTRWPFIAHGAGLLAGVDVVTVVGYRREELPAIYDAARGLAIPTFCNQGFDLTVGEALARRRPVAVFATGSYYWAARDGMPGVIGVQFGDEAALAAVMASDIPPVPEGAADRFRPETHVKSWLEAVVE